MNLLPGHGLGFSGAQLLGFGLGATTVQDIPSPPDLPPVFVGVGGGGMSFGGMVAPSMSLYDNAYSRTEDDAEIVELLSILFQVIE